MKLLKFIKRIIKSLIYKIKNKILRLVFGKKYCVYRKVCQAKNLLKW